jgi:hypothetical protein
MFEIVGTVVVTVQTNLILNVRSGEAVNTGFVGVIATDIR